MAVYNLVMGMVLGTILTGISILAFRRWRDGEGLPSLPGHWLLIFGFAAALADVVAIAVDRSLLRTLYPPGVYFSSYWVQFALARQPELAHLYSQATGWGLGAVAALAFSWHLRRRLARPWLAVFLAFLSVASILSGGAIFALVHLYRSGWAVPRAWGHDSLRVYASGVLLCTLAIVAALARDAARRSPTDGLHRMGVSLWLGIAAVQLSSAVIFLLYA
jgi:hypothetical protein